MINDIHWHDSQIIAVTLLPDQSLVKMDILYPENWEENIFESRYVLFSDAYGYKEYEGAFVGAPTILGVTATESEHGWSIIRLETNAGFRELYCKGCQLV